MRVCQVLIIVAGMTVSSTVLAADYREMPGYPTTYARPAYVPYVPPVYYLPSPPQYVQDLRTGAPGRWVYLQPSFLDRLFGEFRGGY